jgi:hypothetical protein
MPIDYSKLTNQEKLDMDKMLYGSNCYDKDGNWIDIRTVRLGKEDGLIYQSDDWKQEKNPKLIEATINKNYN